jgi:hypothetical protein
MRVGLAAASASPLERYSPPSYSRSRASRGNFRKVLAVAGQGGDAAFPRDEARRSIAGFRDMAESALRTQFPGPKRKIFLAGTVENSSLRRLLLLPAKTVVVLYVVLDSIVTPVVRPLLGWVARLRFVIRLQDIVAALPPYAILVLLAVPFAFAEPAKIYALYLMTEGHFSTGLVTISMAYLVSLLVVERIYHAGREKLKTIPWFAKLMDWLTGIRDRLLAWARATRVWAFSVKLKRTARALAAKLRLRFRAG